MGSNFASGLSSKYGAVYSAATSLANAAKSQLGHTTPEEGPLKHDDVWGIHMAQNFASGLTSGTKYVEKASASLASTIARTTKADIAAANGASGYASSSSQARISNNNTYNLYVNGELLQGNANVNDAIATLASAITQQANMRR